MKELCDPPFKNGLTVFECPGALSVNSYRNCYDKCEAFIKVREDSKTVFESHETQLDAIYWKYAQKDYVELPPTMILPWLHLGSINGAVRFNGNAVLSIINDSYYHTEKFKNKKWLVIDIMDSKDVKINEYFDQAFTFLDNNKNEPCIIHCQAGINRSVTIALAYYMKTTNTKLLDAYEKLSQLRPGIIYNIGFRKCLIEWATVNDLL